MTALSMNIIWPCVLGYSTLILGGITVTVDTVVTGEWASSNVPPSLYKSYQPVCQVHIAIIQHKMHGN